ncbi:hypothetical protein A6E01_17560 [Vibrio breoganii]|uniref:Glycosyltransferase 2-like domain-containing protein n=1 Tax=Vibrio breoganii TaxID=553239 RepID=A0AAN0XYT1_9VIBR|nr:glycosyltransferase [Vibrio breoganii]ANO34982.1 hypothetical protein A6E01_17560 [Vibrio breoganii]
MKLTVGIPFFNPGSKFKDAISSILQQSYRDFELILIDDGSTDGSLEFAKNIKDERVLVFSDGLNKGLPSRLNEIIDRANGCYIARMDADDVVSKYRFERQIKILDESQDIDLVSTGICSISEKYKINGVRYLSGKPKLNDIELLTGRAGICHASIICRKSWYKRNRYNEETERTEDAELWFNAFKKNDLSIHRINEPIYFYREESSASYSNLKKSYISQLGLLKINFGTINKPFSVNLAKLKLYLKLLIISILDKFKLLKLLINTRQKKIDSHLLIMLENELNEYK